MPSLSADAPDKLTLQMVSVIAGVTLLCWVGAKAGCNDRDMPVRFPNPLTEAQGRQTAKSAAIEFAQALASRNWSVASAYAGEPLKQQVAGWEADCLRDQAPCSPIADVFTRATVWSRNGRTESLEVMSHGPFGERTWQVQAARKDDGWSVVQLEEGPRRADSDLAASPSAPAATPGAVPAVAKPSGAWPQPRKPSEAAPGMGSSEPSTAMPAVPSNQ